MGLSMLIELPRPYVNSRMECRVVLRVCLSVSKAPAVALSFVLYEKFFSARCRSEVTPTLAIDPHEPPDATLPANLRAPERRVADGTNIILLEKHGHSKVVVVRETTSKRRAPEIDVHNRWPFRLLAGC